MAKRLDIIDTVGAGSQLTLCNVHVRTIEILNWNYGLQPDGVRTMKIDSVDHTENILAELPEDQSMTLIVNVAEEAYVFGDNETIAIQSTRRDERSSITIDGPKGKANLKQNLSIAK